ncbi:RNA methyltransferase [Nanobdella aerobiophila]|uniref:RNA methyltransferase n=1 Tax=Nanobdella aerobiophila TaxID=2586965 RepID=A0A915WS03_9ARCH|nr:TrmJ/YjtD family RNA methyltransferase [Nanobdella aerobiophila]BBL45386.1 RNA methyltransferase [Nanobdella aerobiophila]
MSNITIIFVEPESEENIGALARVMSNFGFHNLIIINPKVDYKSEKVKIVSRKEGWKIINNARIYEDFEEVVSLFDICYGTTGVSSKKGSELLRNPITPRELSSIINNISGDIGIFFGREANGFNNYELNKFDSIITIPADENFPIMNITHSAAIILYELFLSKNNPIRNRFKLINNLEKSNLYMMFKEFLKVLPTEEYKKPVIYRGFKNLVGKSFLSKREYSLLMGVFRISKENLKRY